MSSTPSARGVPLIICAAPGSAAAPLAEALGAAGLFLGDRPPAGAGVAEDRELGGFQQRLLDAGIPANDARWQDAGRALLARKLGDRPAFGWKDGRTPFVLDFWDAVLPHARWLFVHRDPALVTWSLLRRGVVETASALPMRRAVLALRMWRRAAERMLAFADRHPDRVAFLRAPDDWDAAGEAALGATLARWQIPIRAPRLRAAFRPHLPKRRAPRWIETLARAVPGVAALERALDARRIAGARPPSAADDWRRRPTVCVFAADVKREYSQTFVHEHLRRLPARTLLLHRQDEALLTQDDLPLLSLPERLAAACLRELGYGIGAIRDRALARFLRREGVDAVLAEFANHAAELVGGCRAARVPLVVHFHGFDAFSSELLRQKADDYRTLFGHAAAVVAVSRDMARKLVRLGAPPERVHWAPCGVDPSALPVGDPLTAPPTFVAIGRFVDKKGPHLTLLAFRDVVRAEPESRLVMIGDGPLLAACRTLAEQLGFDGAVELRGASSHAGALAALRGARAFVQHSIVSGGDSEGTPVAVLEASACGIPVVATRHAGIADAVEHGATGYLVAEGDVAGMAAHMLALARDPALAARLGQAARERVLERYATDVSIARLWQVLADAIADRR